jgi:hypothetical protein
MKTKKENINRRNIYIKEKRKEIKERKKKKESTKNTNGKCIFKVNCHLVN